MPRKERVRAKEAATVARRVTARAWALLRQQPAAIGVPETNRRARDLRNNQGRDRTTRQAPRFPARERERELIAFPVPAAPRAFPPSDSRALLPRTPTTSVWVGGSVCGDYWGVGGVIIGRRADVGEKGANPAVHATGPGAVATSQYVGAVPPLPPRPAFLAASTGRGRSPRATMARY